MAMADVDEGYYFSLGLSLTTVFSNIGCDGLNQNGAVVVNVGDLLPAVGRYNPFNSWVYAILSAGALTFLATPA